MNFIYYPLILISILGYGFFMTIKIMNIKNVNLGYQGIMGLFLLTLISYVSTQFLPHNQLFNSLILLFGIIFFITYFKKLNFNLNDYKILILLIFISLIFILVGKNHDDFHYYHFPYTLLLTEFPHPIGLGNLNHGFKTHSSLFLLSSLFYLPGSGYYLFNLPSAYFLIFSNYILLNLIFDKKIMQNFKFIFFLCLSIFTFINIFFYRLGEYGTDRIPMILILLLVINILLLLNKNIKRLDEDLLKIVLIILTLAISMKVLYLIYIILFLPILNQAYKNGYLLDIFNNRAFYTCFLLLSLVFMTNFFNTGCLLFPEKKTCFLNVEWSIPSSILDNLSIHYENWAKAGSGAGYEILESEKAEYISEFNWVSNWLDKYFFNKVSDLLYSLCLLSIIFITTFYPFKKSFIKKRKYKLTFFLLLLIFIEWFYIHPSLRYGGYHLFFLIFFIPISIFLENQVIKKKNINKKIISIICITFLIFFIRNISRLDKEYKVYNYNPINNINYKLDSNSFRVQKRIRDMIDDKEVKILYFNRIMFIHK